MAQFTAYENSNRATRTAYPFLLDIQSDLLDQLRTTLVIPLSPVSLAGDAAIARLCPRVDIDGQGYVVMTPQMAGIDRKHLGGAVGDLSHYRAEVIGAVDFMVSGI